ncbi:MAG: UbiX family flavin prenyltransferase [Ignavibacteria bacterium]|nr:UbiX family flavin prenyltransferase [Ignavibacteria bacterium]
MTAQEKELQQTETKPLEKSFKGDGKNIIFGITGASGSIYALRVLRLLLLNKFDVGLILTEYAQYSLYRECGVELKSSTIKMIFPELLIKEESISFHNNLDLKSEILSIGYNTSGMIVCPCAHNYLAGIAHGECKNLIEKSADHHISHNKPMILVPRDSPTNKIHLKNMLKILDAGGKIVPASPSFENLPKDFNDLADNIAFKVMELLEEYFI